MPPPPQSPRQRRLLTGLAYLARLAHADVNFRAGSAPLKHEAHDIRREHKDILLYQQELRAFIKKHAK